MIPRLIHQYWTGPDPLPPEFMVNQWTWIDHHPGWMLHAWTDATIPELALDGHLNHIAQHCHPDRRSQYRANIVRWELLHRYGGMWVDYDLACIRPIGEYLDGAEVVAAGTPHGADVTLLASVPGHEIWSAVAKVVVDQSPAPRRRVAGTRQFNLAMRLVPGAVRVLPVDVVRPPMITAATAAVERH